MIFEIALSSECLQKKERNNLFFRVILGVYYFGMKKGNNKKNEGMVGKVVALGAGIAALGAASYYFFGPKGKAHRAELKGWMLKMKAEIVEKLEDSKEVTEEAYTKIIDTISAKYAKAGKVDTTELEAYVAKLKKGWKEISGQKKKSAKKVVKKDKTKTPLKS